MDERVSCSSFPENGLLQIIYKAWLLKWLLVSFSVWDEASVLLFSYQNTDLPRENEGWGAVEEQGRRGGLSQDPWEADVPLVPLGRGRFSQFANDPRGRSPKPALAPSLISALPC